MKPNIDTNKIIISAEVIQRWQTMVNCLAKCVKVPNALIIKVDLDNFHVLCSNESENNDFKTGEEKHLVRLYFDGILKEKERQFVHDTQKAKRLCKNRDMKLGKVAYLEFLLLWPDGETFGMLCVLDSKERHFSKDEKDLVLEFKKCVETHLSLMHKQYMQSQELEATEKLYRSLYMNANDAIFLMDFDRFIDCNPKTLQIFSCTKKQVIGSHPYDQLFSPNFQPDGRDSKEKALEKIRLAFEGKPQFFDWRHLRGGVEPFWAEVSLNRIKSAEKNIILAICRDVTEYREAIRESEERLELALKGGDLGLWDKDLQTGKVVRNERTAEIYGYSLNEMEPNVHMWESHIHPDDRPRVLEKRNNYLEGKNSLYEVEYRLRTKSGDWKWILSKGRVVSRDKDNKPLRITGTILDITERKNAEQALREERDKAQQFLDIAGVMIVMIDKECKVRLINRRGCQILGYEEKEIIGKDWFKSFLPKRIRNQVKLIDEKLRAGQTQLVEYFENPVLTKSGEERIIAWHNTLLRDKQGMVIGILSSGEDVTNRRLAEESLKKSEERYRKLVEDAPFGLSIMRSDETFEYLNPKFIEIFGYTLKDIPNKKTWFKKAYPNKEYRENVINVWKKDFVTSLNVGEIQPRIFTVRCRDGKDKIIHFTAVGLKDGKQILTYEDITKRKKNEEELSYRHNFEKLITSISTKFIDLPYDEIDKGINHALKAIGNFADVDRSYVFLLSEDGRTLTNTHEWCAKGIIPQKNRIKNLPIEFFPWAHDKIQRCEVIHIPCIADLPAQAQAEQKEFLAQGIKSLVSVPIILGGKCMGALGFDCNRKERKWPKEIISLLKIVGNIISHLLERQRFERSLKENETLFHTAINSLPFDFFILDDDGRYVMQNSTCRKNWGDIIGKKPEDISQDKDTLKLWEYNNCRAFKGEVVKGEVSFLAQGKKKFYYNIISPIYDNREINRILGINIDISEQKKAEDVLRESEERYHSLFDKARDGIVLIDVETEKIVDCNPAFENQAGRGLDQLRMMKIWELRPEEKIDLTKRKFIEIKNEGKGESSELELQKPNGEIVNIEFVSKIVNIHQKQYIQSIVRDITERKKAEEALRKSENKYKTLVENIPQKIFLKDTNSVYISCNINYAKDLKIKPDEISGKTDFDFYPKKLAEKYKIDDERIIKSGKTEGFEERYIQDGKIAWIFTLKVPVRDANDHIVGILGIFWDITERKKSHQALEKFTKELSKQKKALETKNIALKEVLGQLEVEKRKIQEDIMTNIDELILPIIKKIQLKSDSQDYIRLLERSLKNITSSFGRKIAKKTTKLTPKEIEISNMIKNGLTSKEIANLLNVSDQTVIKHRKNIRNKLRISKKDINLCSFLQQF